MVEVTPRALLRTAGRLGATVQNALEVARFGGLDRGEEEASPYEVVADVGIGHLRRYFPEQADTSRPVALLVPPLMLTAEVWDVSPTTSTVVALAEAGIDPWVVDFGSPEDEEGGLARTLTDHVVTVDRMIDEVRRITGRDVHLLGYSQGGMFCYQVAAVRRSVGIASVVTFGSPVDLHRGLPFGLPAELIAPAAGFLSRHVLGRASLPSWASRNGFKLLDPVKTVRARLDFLLQLSDRERLLAREPQRRFLDGEGFIAYPGPALADLVEQFISQNRMLAGGIVIDDRLVTLADIACPILIVVGDVDELGRPAAVRAIASAAPRAEVHERLMSAGHFGLVVGSKASTITWPTVTQWIHWRETGKGGGDGSLADLVPVDPDAAAEDDEPGIHLGYGLDLFANVGLDLTRSLAEAVVGSTRTARKVADQALEQLPRLIRLERTDADTRLSLGSVLDEQAARSPDGVFFLFEDRAHAYAGAKARIDAVVRGLLATGVRQGQHVGVLMATRPSALVVVAAINRIGAVAVLLRPDGPLERELALGGVTRLVADPERGAELAERTDVPVHVLGGGGDERDLGPTVTDLERIDPTSVEVPGWYRPNPGRASDLAYVLFTGHGDDTRSNRITNRRWALSAYGTASAASLTAKDTVYGLSPIHHPSGLLTSFSGAVAGGARIALAPGFDPDRFWDEIRRYGVTVVSYTWAMCQALLAAPVHPVEKHHPVRLFVGAGMPAGLWRRVARRFAPARVLELYASTEGEAVLVNLTGDKVGSKGRPLPGSAPVELAAIDLESGRIEVGADGYARRCDDDEVGLLLSRLRRGSLATDVALRGVFAPGDAWLATGDLFRRDQDGDHWLVDHAATVTRTERGVVPAAPIEDALGAVGGVDLAVVYGLPRPGRPPIVVAAVTTRGPLEPSDLDRALGALSAAQRPDVVRVVDDLPLTTWYRPRHGPLRDQGLPDDRGWWSDPSEGSYRPLDAGVRADLTGGA